MNVMRGRGLGNYSRTHGLGFTYRYFLKEIKLVISVCSLATTVAEMQFECMDVFHILGISVEMYNSSCWGSFPHNASVLGHAFVQCLQCPELLNKF